MGTEHGGFGQNRKSIKKAIVLLVPFLGVASFIKVVLFLSQRAMVANKHDKKATQQQHELSPVVSQSVLVLPHIERDYRSNPIVKHLYEDGLDQSSVLFQSTSNVDANLVWIVDSQALATGRKFNATGSSSSSEDWCEELTKKVQQVQRERRQASFSDVWPIHFVDNKDKNVLHRCELVENHMGVENVFYHQRAVVTERHFDPEHEWVELGKLLMPPDNIHFVHKPIGVRTDIVQSLEDVLHSKSLSIKDPIESRPRNVDLSYFWEYDTSGRLEGVRLRNIVYRVLQKLQHDHFDEYRFRLGLTGDRGKAGREGVSPGYVEALLNSKIVVVAQRDSWEDHYRLMEALVSGPLVMTDKMLSLPKGLKDGVSLVEYTSADDLQKKVTYYLQHEQERIQIASRGRHVAMSRYRSWHQLEEIVFGHVVTSCTTNDDCMSVHATQRSPPIDKQSGQRLGDPSTENIKGSQRQLLICGGRGSTATKTLFEATCRLGIPSVHWKMQCTPTIPSIQDVVNAHKRLTQVFMSMAFCLDGSIPCPDAGIWRTQIMDLVDKIVRSGVGALHDTPYPSIMSYLLQSVKKNHVVPTIVLSERDPNDWMRSRSMPQKKNCGMDVICKERFTGDGGPFDVFSCMDRALQRLGERAQYSLLNFSNIFTTVRSLADSGSSDHIVFAMREYQDWLRPQANFTMNVFEKTSDRVTTNGLATEMSDALSIDDLQVAKGTKLRITREDFQMSYNDLKTLDKEGSTMDTSPSQLRQQPLFDALSRSFFLFLVILAFSLRICITGGSGIARLFKKRTDGQPGKDKSR